MKAWCLALYLAALVQYVAGCAAEEDEDCTPSLEEWCGEDGCDARPDLDEALAQLRASDSRFDSSQLCGDRVMVAFSTGFTSTALLYEVASGKLVGGAEGSDALTNDECQNEMASAGEPLPCHGETCSLWVSGYTAAASADACQGELAEPFIAACLAEPPSAIAGCEGCACAPCYHTLLPPWEDRTAIAPVALSCVNNHCSVECSTQIDLLEQMTDGGA